MISLFKKNLAACILAMLLTGPSFGQDRGLHNSTKKFTDPNAMSQSDWSSPAEMQRAWLAAIVRVPNAFGGSKKLSTSKLAKWKPKSNKTYPVVVYMHGCTGIWPGTHQRVKFLADNGFIVVAPASLARSKYPQSCDAEKYIGGMYRPTLKMRQYDAGYAIERVRELPFVDGDRIVLMGLSQGGWTTATFKPRNKRQRVRARIVEGITCNAGWSEYVGINARSDEPVLALLGINDPWYVNNKWTKGECTRFLNARNGSKSVVYRTGNLSFKHELLEFRGPRRQVLEFLKSSLQLQ